MVYERYYYMPMPVNADGDGPAMGDEAVATLHEVWDDACLTVCTCGDEAMARRVAEALNAAQSLPPIAQQ
ncbi:hypothetical protein ACLKMW_06095 [Pseudaminobacter sp. NGMCC 1.201702]